MMQKKLLFKSAIIAGLTLMLLIPLTMIEGVIKDRQHYRHEALESIRQSWTGQQSITGPVLVIPYEKHTTHQAWNNATKKGGETHYKMVVAPASLTINAQVNTEERQRGIYKIPVYTSDLKIQGQFNRDDILDQIKTKSDDSEITIKQPYLSLMIADLRGVVHKPLLQWNDEKLEFLPGSKFFEPSNGMHVVLESLKDSETGDYQFQIALRLRGMEKISFSPVGDETSVKLSANWPHPSFTGRYLPTEHQIDNSGFSATWQTSSFSSNSAAQLHHCAEGNCDKLFADVFGVSFIKPVDTYLQSERSAKYGILFLTLTFVLFFLYEVMRKLSVHPIQYLLVGLALAIFFLLLVSVSEVLPFAVAYGFAAIACTTLLGSYVSGALDNSTAGKIFSGVLAILYAVLYIIINSEDNALLMGSLLLFFVLAAVMMITRRIDWYTISDQLTTHQGE